MAWQCLWRRVNVRFYGDIFDIVAIETTSRLTYPNSTSLSYFNKGHNAIHNKKGTSVDYDNAIDFLGKETSELIGKMVSTIKNSFLFPN